MFWTTIDWSKYREAEREGALSDYPPGRAPEPECEHGEPWSECSTCRAEEERDYELTIEIAWRSR